MEPNEQDIAQQKFKENYTMGIKKPTNFVMSLPENRHGIDNKVTDLDIGQSVISGNITFDGSSIISPPIVVTLQNLDGVMALQSAATLTDTQLIFAGSTGLLVQDADLTFVTDTLFVPKVNRVTITAPAASATLTIANTKTLTVNGDTTLTNGTHSGTNTGDQTSIVGITGTKAEFDTAVTDGNFLYSGDVTQYTDEMAQDAVGTILTDSTTVDFTYNDGGPTITADVTGAIVRLSATVVAFNADADTTIYTVPAGKTCILHSAIVVAGADAGATTQLSIGQDTAETDFIPANTLSNLDAANDAVILMPVPNTTPTKTKAYATGTVIQAKVTTQSGGATNTLYLFGMLF